jgi:hypothetical protein
MSHFFNTRGTSIRIVANKGDCMRRHRWILFLLIAPLAHAADFPAWMAGSWRGSVAGVEMEEYWTDSKGELMLGAHRDIRGPKKTYFELLRIERHEDGNLYYMAMPGGLPATQFKMTAGAGKRVVFENPEHDFPRRIIYWQPAPKTLCARVEGIGDEPEKAEEYCWARVAVK